MALRKSGGLLGGLIVSSCSQLAAFCWLKLVGNDENEGSLVGEGEEDEKKAISLGLVWN
ncbi:hypothetical protein KY289_003245 [Solanum tuberosum]|nr:hypothetical protein KY284_030349 [Solanum tuberosum]KAH0732057.1 hypothetical protein KY289_003245 [Solanum tuberosum]